MGSRPGASAADPVVQLESSLGNGSGKRRALFRLIAPGSLLRSLELPLRALLVSAGTGVALPRQIDDGLEF